MAGAVVGGEDQECVVQLVDGAQMFDQSSDLCICMFEETCPCFLQPAHEIFLILAQCFPGLYARILGWQASAVRDNPKFGLLLEIVLTDDVPIPRQNDLCIFRCILSALDVGYA